MQKIVTLGIGLSCLVLAGCGFHVYQPSVQQGNIMSQAEAQQIKPGMSREQVKHILDEPVLANIFDENHWAYVYTFQKNGGEITRKNLDVYFQNNHVSRTTYSEGKVVNAG